MITLDEFTNLNVDARRSYLARHPEDTRFDPDTIGDYGPAFTEEYTKTLQDLWPEWEESHRYERARKRTDLVLMDRLYQAGFTEFKFEMSYATGTYVAELYGHGISQVPTITARKPETEEIVRYHYTSTDISRKWVSSKQLAREAKAAQEAKEFIAGRLEHMLLMGNGTYPGSQKLKEDTLFMAEKVARGLGPKALRDIYGAMDGFDKDISGSRSIARLFEDASYEDKQAFLIDAANLHGVLADGYTVSGFVEELSAKAEKILSDIRMYELKDAGRERQEKEMSWFREDPNDIRKMLVYPYSAQNIDYETKVFCKVMDIEAARPGRALTSMINPSTPGSFGYLAYPINLRNAIMRAHKEGRDEEITALYKRIVEGALPENKAAMFSDQLVGPLSENAIAEAEKPDSKHAFPDLGCAKEMIYAAARESFTEEEIRRTIDVCFKNPYPGFRGFTSKSLAEYISEQTDENARKIIMSEDPGREAGIMRTRAHMERKVAQIEKEEKAIALAESRGEDVSNRKEKLSYIKEDFAKYVNDRLKHIGSEDLDDFITPSEQNFVLKICEEEDKKEEWFFQTVKESLERAQLNAKAQAACIYIDEDVVVYAAENADRDEIWGVLLAMYDESAKASVTFDMSTGHIFAAYDKEENVPKWATAEYDAYRYKVDMTEMLGGPATKETAASKVASCARMVMESLNPPTTIDRVNELTEAYEEIHEEMQDCLGKGREEFKHDH